MAMEHTWMHDNFNFKFCPETSEFLNAFANYKLLTSSKILLSIATPRSPAVLGSRLICRKYLESWQSCPEPQTHQYNVIQHSGQVEATASHLPSFRIESHDKSSNLAQWFRFVVFVSICSVLKFPFISFMFFLLCSFMFILHVAFSFASSSDLFRSALPGPPAAWRNLPRLHLLRLGHCHPAHWSTLALWLHFGCGSVRVAYVCICHICKNGQGIRSPMLTGLENPLRLM